MKTSSLVVRIRPMIEFQLIKFFFQMLKTKGIIIVLQRPWRQNHFLSS